MRKILIVLSSLLLLVPKISMADIYEDLARATGGSVAHNSKEDFLKSVNDGKTRYGYLKNANPITMQSIRVTSTNDVNFSIPVDGLTFGSLVIEVIGLNSKAAFIRITDPNGKIIEPLLEAGDPYKPVQVSLEDRQVIIVPGPSEGLWSVKATGAFSGDLLIRLQSRLAVMKAEFVRLGGRPGHQGMFSYAGSLKAGEKEIFEFSLFRQKAEGVSVVLIDEEGNILQKAISTNLFGSEAGNFSRLKIPEKPFRIIIKGKGFQRIIEKLYTPEMK